MAKLLILVFLFSVSFFSQGQVITEFELLQNCSHLKQAQNKLKSSEDFIQPEGLNDYNVGFYKLDLTVSCTSTFIEGSVLIRAKVEVSDFSTFVFELIDEMTIDSVLINQETCLFDHSDNGCFVTITSVLPQGQTFDARIFYHGTPPSGNFFSGINIAYDSTWNQSHVWTLSEPFNARQWWPSKQVLTDKADSVWVFLTTDAQNKAGSIGLLTNTITLPNGKIRYEWKSRYPIDYYLISFAVAKYQDYTIYSKPSALNGDSIPIQNYIYNSSGCLEFYKTGIDRTSELIELFSDLYSLYPFHEEKYGHCLTSLSGGMEHQTMTTIGNFGLGIVAHELAHMWFGDNVTCATWSDIWVNEGFATYSDYLAHEMIAGPPWPSIWLNNSHNYVLSKPDGSVYIPPEEITYDNENRIFDGRLTYYKGALILHMIRYTIKDDNLFFQVFKNYQTQFKDSVATSQDFISVLNATTGQDFTMFFDQWFFGQGYPIYQIDWSLNNGVAEITSNQTASAPEITPFFNMKLPVTLYFNDATDTIIEIDQTQPSVTKSVIVTKGVDSLKVDPDNWVLKKVEAINGIGDSNFLETIYVSPNPFRDFLNVVVTDGQAFEINILNIAGQHVHNQYFNYGTQTIPMSHLENGIYLIRIKTDKEQKVFKFIKH